MSNYLHFSGLSSRNLQSDMVAERGGTYYPTTRELNTYNHRPESIPKYIGERECEGSAYTRAIKSLDKTTPRKDKNKERIREEGRIGGTKLNCPSDIGVSAFLPGIFIANVLRARRHFYETRAASRNRARNNGIRRRIFPKRRRRRAAARRRRRSDGEARRIEIRWVSRRGNSTKTVFLRAERYLI